MNLLENAATHGASDRGVEVRLRKTTRCIAALALVVAAMLATGVGAEAQTTRNPILFVHGWNSSASTWNTMIGRFQSAG